MIDDWWLMIDALCVTFEEDKCDPIVEEGFTKEEIVKTAVSIHLETV